MSRYRCVSDMELQRREDPHILFRMSWSIRLVLLHRLARNQACCKYRLPYRNGVSTSVSILLSTLRLASVHLLLYRNVPDAIRGLNQIDYGATASI